MSTAAVYACNDATGRSVYIGHTEHVSDRIDDHRTRAAWWPQVASVDVYPCDSREVAVYLERNLIRECGPLYNVAANTVRPGAGRPALRKSVDSLLAAYNPPRMSYPGMTPVEYGAHLAAQAGPVNEATVEAAARIFATQGGAS